LVKRVEELLLRVLLPGDELDVVHQPDVHGLAIVPQLLRAPLPDRGYVVVGEVLTIHEADARAAVQLPYAMRHGVEQVRLAHTRRAVDQQRVECLRGRFGGRTRSVEGQPVAWAHDE